MPVHIRSIKMKYKKIGKSSYKMKFIYFATNAKLTSERNTEKEKAKLFGREFIKSYKKKT